MGKHVVWTRSQQKYGNWVISMMCYYKHAMQSTITKTLLTYGEKDVYYPSPRVVIWD
jgi:hypothetical protein